MEHLALAEHSLALLRNKAYTLTTAESCTGGLIMATLTAIAGSSDVVDRGFVTYSNQSKHELLGVPTQLLEQHGAVSHPVAAAIAAGALAQAGTHIALSVTGIAGPGGGSAEKPVGLVYIGLATRTCDPIVHGHQFTGTRHDVRSHTVRTALELISHALQG